MRKQPFVFGEQIERGKLAADVAGEIPASKTGVSQQVLFDAVKFATSTTDGSQIEVTEVKDAESGSVTYLDASGADVTATVTAAPYDVRDYVVPVLLGNEVVTVTGGAPATLTPPASAGYGYANVNGADAMYAIGAAPLADTDHRVSDGGRIELCTAGDLAGVQIDALDGATSFKMRVYYYNVNPENTAT